MTKLTFPRKSHPGQIARIKAARAERDAKELAKQRITVRCAHCCGPGNHGRVGRPFQFTGPIMKAQRRFAEHRARVHPELVPLDEAKLQQKRLRRRSPGSSKTASSYFNQRQFLSADELKEREVLRRLVRTDLPSLEPGEATAA